VTTLWRTRHARRIAALGFVASAGSLALLALAHTTNTQSAPSGCTDISTVAPIYSGIQYGAAIQGLFVDFDGMGNGCSACHTSNMGTNTPAGNLNLDPSETSPYANLVNIPSDEDPALVYVVPNHPEQSLLFEKINCETPAVGTRMPYGYPALSPYQQALIYDWIAEGAPVGTTDGVFRDGFDGRGFAP